MNIQDTFLLHSSYDQGYIGNALDNLCMKYLQIPSWKSEAWGKVDEENERRRKLPLEDPERGDPATLADIHFNDMAMYNGKDCINPLRLYHALTDARGVPDVYETLLLPIVGLLADVSLRGIRVNEQRRAAIERAYRKKADELYQTLRQAPEVKQVEAEFDGEFNIRSNLHIIALMQILGIQVFEQTKTGKPKTDKATLARISENSTLFRRILVVRDMANIVSKFLVPLKYHVARDSRVHTTFRLGKTDGGIGFGSDPTGGTATGRLSSADPPLHNMKKDNVLRSIFEAAPNHLMTEIDQSHFEVRGITAVADVKALRKIFNRGQDPYKDTASKLYRVAYEDVTAAMRKLCKTGFLASLYGIGPTSFANKCEISLDEAKGFFKQFNKLFPEIADWQKHILALVSNGRPVITLSGRTRVFLLTGDDDKDAHVRNAAINYPIQSICSDITLIYAMAVQRLIPSHRYAIVNLVHDALWAEVPVGGEQVISEVARIMTDPTILPFKFDCPLSVAASLGRHLGTMQEYTLAA